MRSTVALLLTAPATAGTAPGAGHYALVPRAETLPRRYDCTARVDAPLPGPRRLRVAGTRKGVEAAEPADTILP
jgi:hypothetical protein